MKILLNTFSPFSQDIEVVLRAFVSLQEFTKKNLQERMKE